VLRNGVIYVGTNTGVVRALDADDGDDRWSFPTADGPVKNFVFPDRVDQDLYFSTTNKVWGIRDGGGAAVKKWVEIASIPSPSTPVHPVGSDILYVGGGDGRLYQINDALAGNPTPAPVVTSVQLGDGGAAAGAPSWDDPNGVVYVGTTAGIVYAVVPPLP
jgi:outer membrane protein assembly factor BamB